MGSEERPARVRILPTQYGLRAYYSVVAAIGLNTAELAIAQSFWNGFEVT